MFIDTEVKTWLKTLPDWQQLASKFLLEQGELGKEQLEQITLILKGLSKTQFNGLQNEINQSSLHSVETNQIRLLSLGNITGIDNLKPRNKLTFGNTNLFVVYGRNGSGKSGYVRILKKICGKPTSFSLRANLFEAAPEKRTCEIAYSIDTIDKLHEWNAAIEAPIEQLTSVDIFDGDAAKLYLAKEAAVAYTPPILAIFDLLVQANQEIRSNLQSEKDKLVTRLPLLPAELSNTQAAIKYQKIQAGDNESTIKGSFSWSEVNRKHCESIEQRLAVGDHLKQASQLKARVIQIDTLLEKMEAAIAGLPSKLCNNIATGREVAAKKKLTATEGQAALLGSMELSGVATETWRELWLAARNYSTALAYPSTSFPNIDSGALCVLCNQPLSAEAKLRLHSFEQFITSELETQAAEAGNALESMLKMLPVAMTPTMVQLCCEAAGLTDTEWTTTISAFWADVSTLVENLKSELPAEKGLERQNYQILELLSKQRSDINEQAIQFERDSEDFDRVTVSQERLELLAMKWTSEQLEAIVTEVERLRKLAEYDSWIKQTDSAMISKKAGVFAERILTTDYIARFNAELKALGAERLRVDLVKTRTDAGKPLHGLRLRTSNSKTTTQIDILSDGEKRIVGLAAFLADVTGRPGTSPFIFDDPISSLDQDFEEKTIDRLIALSADRQVIIFTHRLSFFGIINDKALPDHTSIRHEHWGAGEPATTPLFAKAPMKSLNALRDQFLTRAEKAWKEEGSEAYYPLGRAICGDFRIILERIIEQRLMADVVARHRRDVQTKNKIKNLAKINSVDCNLFEDLMSAYSCFEHSQPLDAPVEVPEPPRLREDIEKVITWNTEFEQRK